MNRPTLDEYFMMFVNVTKTRSTCLRRAVGAVLVKDKHIIATGYNGAPAGCPHCDEVGCIRQQQNVPSGTKHELCRAAHAEQNAIAQAAFFGTPTNGSTIYISTQPCIICTKILINAGVKKVVYAEGYDDKMSLDMLEAAGIEVVKLELGEDGRISKTTCDKDCECNEESAQAG